MSKKFRIKLLISSALVLLPMVLGLILWNKTPELLATHWGFSGQPDGWSGRGMAVFGLPLILLGFHWLCLFITLKLDPKNKELEGKALGLVFWLVPLVSFFANGIVYATAFGKNWDMENFVMGFIGVLFIVLGNYMPKYRQNYTMGIKLPWTLNNEENWNATHRFGGKVWVIGGLMFLLSVFLPGKLIPAMLAGLILVLVLLPTLYSYLYYRKQLAAGTATKEDASFVPRGMSKKAAYGSLAIAVLILAGVAVLMFTGNISYTFNEDSFTVEADYWDDLTVEYAAVESLEYLEDSPRALRTHGFGSGRLAMGLYENEELGSHTRYCYIRCPSAVVLRSQGKTLVLSAADETGTLQLYENLLTLCGG